MAAAAACVPSSSRPFWHLGSLFFSFLFFPFCGCCARVLRYTAWAKRKDRCQQQQQINIKKEERSSSNGGGEWRTPQDEKKRRKETTNGRCCNGRTDERTNECWRGESASCCCSFIICNQQKGAVGHVSLLLLCWSLRDCVCLCVGKMNPAVAMHNSHPNCKLWLLVFSVFFFSFLFAVVPYVIFSSFIAG